MSISAARRGFEYYYALQQQAPGLTDQRHHARGEHLGRHQKEGGGKLLLTDGLEGGAFVLNINNTRQVLFASRTTSTWRPSRVWNHRALPRPPAVPLP